MLLISQPEAQIDAQNRLHVLTQFGMRQFMHLCVDAAGDLRLRNTYEASGGVRPILKTTDAGSVFVKSGQRLLRQDDIPPSALLNRPLPARPEAPAEEAKEGELRGTNGQDLPAVPTSAGDKPTR
jgi:hypothetical protein